MAALIYPLRRVMRPQGPVEIDWSDPITQGLVSALMPEGAGYVDYLRRESYPSLNGLIGHSRHGKIVSLDGTGYTNLGATSIGGVNLFASAASGSWTAVTCAKAAESGSTGTFLAKAGSVDSSKTFHIFRTGTGVSTPTVILRGSTNATSWGFTDTEYHQYAVSFKASTAVATAYGDDDKRLTLSIAGAAEQSENIVIGARTGGSGARLTGETAYTYFFNRALSQQEVSSLYRNPWQIFRPIKRVFHVGAPATSHQLQAGGLAQAAATAALSVQAGGASVTLQANGAAQAAGSAQALKGVALAAAGVAVASGGAVVAHSVPLQASAVAAATSGGSLAIGITLSASALAQASASAGMAKLTRLSAAAAATAAGSATLAGTNSSALAAQATAQAASTGELSVMVRLSSTAVSQAMASAGLAHTTPLAAAGAVLSSASASLAAAKRMAGSGGAVAAGGASLWVSVPMSAAALAQAASAGSLQLSVRLDASALAQATASAVLSAPVYLSAAGEVVATGSGTLQAIGAAGEVTPGWSVGADGRSFNCADVARHFEAFATGRNWKV